MSKGGKNVEFLPRACVNVSTSGHFIEVDGGRTATLTAAEKNSASRRNVAEVLLEHLKNCKWKRLRLKKILLVLQAKVGCFKMLKIGKFASCGCTQ